MKNNSLRADGMFKNNYEKWVRNLITLLTFFCNVLIVPHHEMQAPSSLSLHTMARLM
jgi:hypothetical protein